MRSPWLACTVLQLCFIAAGAQQPEAGWKTFDSRAGWSIRYTADWLVSSCRTCRDLSDSRAFVHLADRQGKQSVLVERLADKDSSQTIEDALETVAREANLNPVVPKEWFTRDRGSSSQALKVTYRSPGGQNVESWYLGKGNVVVVLICSSRTHDTMQVVESFQFR